MVKNHPFIDGNKRSAAFLFVDFLNRNGRLVGDDGRVIINDIGLAALTLLVAESLPVNKESMIKLILNMLAEASTKDISQATNPKDFDESKKVAQQGGNVAKVALRELESKTGKKVVSSMNAKSVLGIDKSKKEKDE